MTLRSCCSVSVRAPSERGVGGDTTRSSWLRYSTHETAWDPDSSERWGHSQEPSPGPTCRRGPRGHISRAHRALAGLACHPARAQRWWPWCFAIEYPWDDITEARRCPGNTPHGARTAASGPCREPSALRSEITWLPGLQEEFPTEATRKRLLHLSALDPVELKRIRFLRAFGSVVYLDPFLIGGMPAEPVVWHFSGDLGQLPWLPQQMSWTPRPSSQSRKVYRVGQGTVQTSSQMITWGTNFCPILSGVQSVWPLHRKKLW